MRTRQVLDGLWEFLPRSAAPDAAPTPADIPRAGYAAERIRVPGYWRTFPPDVGGDWGAYDHYRYPPEWQAAPAAWYRLVFRPAVPFTDPPGRIRLGFDAVAGHSTVFLNGQALGENADSFLPFAFDVTNLLRPDADNELCVHVAPPRTRAGLWLQPCGSWVGWHMRGIWQPVWLETVPVPAIADVFVQPSVRRQRLVVDVTLDGAGGAADATVRVAIVEGEREVLDLGALRAVVAARGPGSPGAGDRGPTEAGAAESAAEGGAVLRFARAWPDARCWSPDDPHLYHARVELAVAGRVVDTHWVRFGFREFWIDGTRFVLNGRPLRLFGDSWHYMGVAQQNPAYARTWFTFARQVGVNAIRTHAMPYPPCYFDVADEMGMLLIDETAIYGSAGTLAFDAPEFWEACRDHVRRLVRRDRNHPSVIFWSAVNETVWKGGERIFPGLVSLMETARALDPTRLVTCDENDCHVGGAAVTHAGHYGTAQHWERSWRRDRPLTVHEFSALYHGGPENCCGWGDEAVYADFDARLRATGEDAADMFFRLRALGAASITPWNLNWYCLTPGPPEPVEPVPPEATAGGPTFDRIGPDALTFNYGYRPGAPPWVPNPALAPLARCYVRRQVYLPHRPRQGFAGQTLRVRGHLWNDTDAPLTGAATVRLRPVEWTPSDERLAGAASRATDSPPARPMPYPAETQPVRLPPHSDATVELLLRLPPVAAVEACACELMIADEAGREICAERWTLHIHPAGGAPRRAARPAYVWSAAGVASVLVAAGLTPVADAELARVWARPDATVVLAGPDGGRTLAAWVARPEVDAWLRAGGRLVVLPGGVADDACTRLAPIRRPFDRAFPRVASGGGAVLIDGLTADHFRDWGDDGVVAREVYERPTTGPALAPLDVGDAAAGLLYSPLVLVGHGRGCVAVVGFDLAARVADTPAAALLLERLVSGDVGFPVAEADGAVAVLGSDAFRQAPLWEAVGVPRAAEDDPVRVMVCDGSSADVLHDARAAPDRIAALLDAGGTLLVAGLTPETAPGWAARLGLRLGVHADERYNVARCVACDGRADSPLLAGLNNYDLCWVNRDEKQPIVRWTLAPDCGDPAARVLVQSVATRWEDYQTAHEQHKVALMLRRIRAFDGPRAAVVEIPRGRGRIVLCQLELAAARGSFRPRAERILSRWLDACGAARWPAVSPLVPRAAAALRPDGYIVEWLVLGPFDPESAAAPADAHPLDYAYVDEAALRPGAGASVAGRTWRRVASALPHVDLTAALGPLPPRDRVAYVAVHVHAAQDRSVLLDAPDLVTLLLGSDGGSKVWLNGAPLGRFDFVRELVLDNDRVPGVPLRRGWNTLLIKLHNPSGAWRFAARFLSVAGEPVGELRCQAEPPDAPDSGNAPLRLESASGPLPSANRHDDAPDA